MDEGHTFYTVGGGKRAAVETYFCSHMKLLFGVGILLIVVWVAGELIHWPWVLTNHEAVRNLGLVAVSVIAVPLAIWRALVAERQAETARRSLLNERDQKAAEMLGSELISVRLGGIYALQTLAAEHPAHYHLGVMRQFCAFVREQQSTVTGGEPAREDVRAVMDAIATRSDAGIGNRRYAAARRRSTMTRARIPYRPCSRS